ncbi:MAG: extracellular solute-binding protein [Bacteroidota bacterium]
MNRVLRQHWGVLFLSFIAIMFILVQVFFSAHRRKTVTKLYFADKMTEAHRVLIDEYNRLHEGEVDVIPVDFPNVDFTTNERKEVLARSLRGEGDGIDVFAVDPIWVQRFERWSEPLDKYFSSAELGGITDEALHSCYRDGKLVAIPFGVVRGVLFYREDLLRSLPHGSRIIDEVNRGITWDRFVRYGESLHGPNPYYLYPAAEYEGLLCVFTELLLGLEKDYFNVHGFNFETPQAKRALQLLVDLVQRYRVTPQGVTSMTEVSSYEYFLSHKGLFLRGWTSYDKDFAMTPDEKRLLRMAPLPHFRDGEPASTIGGWDLMVSKFSTKKEAAISFVKFLLRKESQEIIFTKGGFFPVVRALYEEESYKRKLPELIEVSQMLAHGVHRPSNEKYTKYSEILAPYVSRAIGGRITVEDALLRATKAIQSEKISPERGM